MFFWSEGKTKHSQVPKRVFWLISTAWGWNCQLANWSLGGGFHCFYFHPDSWGNDPIWLIFFQPVNLGRKFDIHFTQGVHGCPFWSHFGSINIDDWLNGPIPGNGRTPTWRRFLEEVGCDHMRPLSQIHYEALKTQGGVWLVIPDVTIPYASGLGVGF